MAPSRKSHPVVRKIKQAVSEYVAEEKSINPFAQTCINISQPRDDRLRSTISRLKTENGQIRLALISLPRFDAYCTREVDTFPERSPKIEKDPYVRRLTCFRHASLSKIFSYYEQALKTAFEEEKANIVCINELGLPASFKGPYKKSLQLVKQLVDNYSGLVIAGSYHDYRTTYNTAHIYYPGCNEFGILYHKQVSALEEGERIGAPSKRETAVIRAFGLTLNIIICIDLLDYSTVASIIKQQADVDLLIVPSFMSQSPQKMKYVAIAASTAMPGAVAITNYFSEDNPSSLLYQFGVITPPKHIRYIYSPKGQISLYDIDVQSFKHEKDSRQYNLPKELAWLFGIQPLRQLPPK